MAGSAWERVSGTAAEVYERHLVPAMFAPWTPRLLDLADVRPGERVLDVACGTGVVARLAARRVGADGRAVGLDINPAMVAVARSLPGEGGAAVEWLEANALALPFPDAEFDVVLCQQGVQQVPDRLTALREMHRVLAPGGRVAICVWDRIEANPAMAALARALGRRVGPEAEANRRAPFALGDRAELERLLMDAGFQGVETRTEVMPARFPSIAAFVAAQLGATPLSTLGGLSDDARAAVLGDVRAEVRAFEGAEGFAVPMAAHLALGRV